ncbi:MAG TPA: tRNA (cytidine(56)-2'-O)-methyltransferase [Thermoplasmata archaeon]|nr:tRNA (cytidine(56)-2'-O)-methyltransferase [Thermoplasmata archaeon]
MPSRPRRSRAPRPSVEVLRVGHRPQRDPRLTTHLALVARAFGAVRLHLNPPDPEISDRLRSVARRWGGAFEVVGAANWRTVCRTFPGPVAHLTMYGVPIADVETELRSADRLLLVVGGAKVPPELFGAATHNVAVGHQPHSEVAALAVVLDRVVGAPDETTFAHARQRIRPSRRGKVVVTEPGGVA